MASGDGGDDKAGAPNLPNLRDNTKPWLFQPTDRAALGDIAKLAVTLRTGTVQAPFLDEGFAEVVLGNVGRVLMLAPSDLGLPADRPRKFALARGTTQLCLAEIVAGTAGEKDAAAFLDAVARQIERSEGKPVVGWLIADRVTPEARGALAEGGCVSTSTSAPTT